LLAAIEKALFDQGIHSSWHVCRLAVTPESDVQQLYRNLAIPPQVVTRRTWITGRMTKQRPN
jgi:hypothetical protein